ncbi:hypothetical protein GCM10011385_41400 [Nitratireductor aestuarii]|uniref:Uncharacterized protein n=1 Tax=Nitratireductor aestuarii TaxID=1735103 RepID=A0A916S3Q0_9HYPH|nr:hypothetical protein GCM10011385_41400 [Nitratireductor aestuarii]
MPTYIPDWIYDRLVKALEAIEPCPLTGDRSAKINEALCMIGGVWPESVRVDAANGRLP